MATIRETKSGRWQAIVRRVGFPNMVETLSTKTKAQEWARRVETEMEDGRHFRNAEAKRRTLGDAVDRFIRDNCPDLASGDDYADKLKWWRAQLGHLKLADIHPALVTEYRDKLRRTPYRGKKRSNATVNRYVAYLRSMFTTAKTSWRWTSVNPVDVEKLPERGRERFLNDDEYKVLFAAIAKNPKLYTFAMIALSTACRAGELQKLRWADVDLKAGQLLFRNPKNTHTRTAWVAGLALELLREYGKVRPIGTDALVFAAETETKSGVYEYYPEYVKAVAAAKIMNLTFHDLRHTAATWLARDGATERQLMAAGGWKSPAMVTKYVNLAAMDTKAVMERFAQKLTRAD